MGRWYTVLRRVVPPAPENVYPWMVFRATVAERTRWNRIPEERSVPAGTGVGAVILSIRPHG